MGGGDGATGKVGDRRALRPDANHLRLAFHPLGARRFIVNWEEVARHLLGRPARELRLFSTIMALGTPRDVTLQELRLETFFPADTASEAAWRAISGPADRAPRA